MKAGVLILVILGTVLCSSCYSYKIATTENSVSEISKSQRTAYIINDTLKEESKILARSELFDLVSDSTLADVKLKLNPMDHLPGCGQPILVTLVTLGQVPISLPDRYVYSFDEMENTQVVNHELLLQMKKRFWFWDIFVFNKKFAEKAGNLLAEEYRQNEY